jgi:hypothetical protein
LEDEEDELIRLMALRFLMGEDKEFFDYSSVDKNEKYDDLELINRDSEEKYFDEEEANEVTSSEYTGIQDY